MISVDTNVVVRLLTHDDEGQYKKAYRVFRKNDVFVADTVILETEWVLRFTYGFSTDEICDAFSKLFGLPNVQTANPVTVHQAIQWHRQGLDFSDALHLAGSQHCSRMFSFDRAFIKETRNLPSCPVSMP